MKNKLFLLVVVISALSLNTIQAQSKYFCDSKKSEIKYFMSHPLHDWNAINTNVKSGIVYNLATKQITSLAVSVAVKDFDSKDANRDSHAIEVLEAFKYPTIQFVSTNIENKNTEVIIHGNLVFHNVTKSYTIVAKKNLTRETLVFDCEFEVSMINHKVERPSLMGMKTKDTIKLQGHFEFKLK